MSEQNQKKRRSLLIAVLAISVVALVGTSIAPIILGVFDSGSSARPTIAASVDADRARLEEEAKSFEIVLGREPDNQNVLEQLLRIRLELNDIKGAIEPLKKLVELNPDRVQYGILLAQAQTFDRDFEAAAASYRNILKTRPGNIEALQGLAALQVQQGAPEAAIGLLEDTLKTAPELNRAQPGSVDVASVQLTLGEVYAKQQRYDEALAIYEEIGKNNPQDFRPVYAKGLLLKEQGKNETANALFTKASELAPAQYKDRILEKITASPSSSEEVEESAVREEEDASEEDLSEEDVSDEGEEE